MPRRRSKLRTQTIVVSDLNDFQNNLVQAKNPYFYQAVREVRSRFKLPARVKILHLNDLFRRTDLEIWGESPGLPWHHRGYQTIDDIRRHPKAVREVRRIWHRIKRGQDVSIPDCCTDDGDEHKVRAVWPAVMTLCEGGFAIPLIEAYKKRNLIRSGRFVHRFYGQGIKFVFDFSEFDEIVPDWLIDFAFDILVVNIDVCNYRGYGVPDGEHAYRLYFVIKDYFINTPIRTASGLKYEINFGIPSGSYFSQLIHSVYKAIVIDYIERVYLGKE
ncbi:hypothetical protein C0J52_08930 [Blattella germanica]|nr:hypothetical protein C0J52_08930 [Blattella germanica]